MDPVRLVTPETYVAAFIHYRPHAKDDHEAKQFALALIDWAILESNRCPEAKLEEDSSRALIRKGGK